MRLSTHATPVLIQSGWRVPQVYRTLFFFLKCFNKIQQMPLALTDLVRNNIPHLASLLHIISFLLPKHVDHISSYHSVPSTYIFTLQFPFTSHMPAFWTNLIPFVLFKCIFTVQYHSHQTYLHFALIIYLHCTCTFTVLYNFIRIKKLSAFCTI